MKTVDIRRKFIQYFNKQGHSIVPSSPVFLQDDPTLLFINAGMNQFKDVFLGKSKRDYNRACSSQKCIRVGGKHNDLENVGHTSRHLTFFEMLGNFSFGEYFKKEAIQFAWEVSTEVFGFEEEKLWPTVFREDDEAFELWKAYVPESKITRFDEADNFWSMGNTGPCGPCSELFYDKGNKYGKGTCPSEDIDGERFLEFWNLVFMQFNKDEEGMTTPLPKPSIDTGAGIERIMSLIEGVDSLFETDILRSLISEVENISGVKYESGAAAFHVIADHIRTLSFSIADGVQPSNLDRGYVLRKVLRRAVRYGRQLGMTQPFLGKLVPRLIGEMGEDFPEIKTAQNRIEEILHLEEEGFIKTLQRGGNLLNQIIDNANTQISGDDAFKLKDTYGFPLEEITLIAKDAQLLVDIERYNVLEKEARERSRNAQKDVQQVASESIFENFIEEHGTSTFCGYDKTECNSTVTGLFKDGEAVDELHDEGLIILKETPFYAEKGGQVGDKGLLTNGRERINVINCIEPFPGVIAHHVKIDAASVKIGDPLTACINIQRRQKIANNYTATHILHWALRQVLGDQVKQAGSVVDDKRLRFDFSHHKAVSNDEVLKIEDLVNEKIRLNSPINAFELPYKEAQKRSDIIQFFGDKYGKTVRVVDIDFSKELCGGTHTRSSGNIGFFRIHKESSIAAGVRRIEAVCGYEAESFTRKSDIALAAMAEQLKIPVGKVGDRIQKLLEENKELNRELKNAQKAQQALLVKELASQCIIIKGIPVLTAELNIEAGDLKDLSDSLLEDLGSVLLTLANVSGPDKCQLFIQVSADLVSKGVKANELIKVIAPIVNGGGGGKPNLAQAGGKDPSKIPEALAKLRDHIEETW